MKIKTWNTINFFLLCFGYLLFSFVFSFLFKESEQSSILFRVIIIIIALLTLIYNFDTKFNISIEQKLLLLLFSFVLLRLIWNTFFGYEKDIEISEIKRVFYINLYTLIGLLSLIFSSEINYQLFEKLLLSFLTFSILYIAYTISDVEIQGRFYFNENIKVSQTSLISQVTIYFSVICYNNFKSKSIKFLLFFLSIISIYLIVITQSRIALISLLILLFLTLYNKNKLLLIIISLFLIFLAVTFLFSEDYILVRRFLEFEFYESRINLYSQAFEKIKSNIFIGSGFSFPFGKDHIYYGHNIFIDIIHMTGVLGLIIIYYPLKQLLKHHRKLFIKTSKSKNIISILSLITLIKLMTSGSLMFEPLFFFTCFILTKTYSKK